MVEGTEYLSVRNAIAAWERSLTRRTKSERCWRPITSSTIPVPSSSGRGRRRLLTMLIALLLGSGCATYQDWTVEDWDVSYKDCQVKLDWDSGKIKCKWRVSLLGT